MVGAAATSVTALTFTVAVMVTVVVRRRWIGHSVPFYTRLIEHKIGAECETNVPLIELLGDKEAVVVVGALSRIDVVKKEKGKC